MKKNNCPYCGNNPVPHHINWYFESLNILLTPLRQALLYNPLTRLITNLGWGSKIAKAALKGARVLGIVTVQSDIKKCKVQRAMVLWEEADRRNVEMDELLLFGKPFDSYTAKKKSLNSLKSLVFSGLPRPAGYINRWLDLMDDKWLFKKKLMENGLPVPIGGSCWNMGQAKEIFENIQKSELRNEAKRPVIVKPRAGSRGRHSTTFVSSREELKTAFKIAKQLCFWVMVEQQLAGPVYRATVINFEVCGVLRGDPPQLAGDGISGIAELIADKNQKPHPGVKDIVVDDQIKLFLSRQNLSLSSVPQKDLMINLSEKIGVNYGGSSSEDYETCHPDNKELFARAAKVLGDPLVGFDFIIPDITKSYKEQKCGFIEVNSLPFINLHHDPLLGTPRNVAAKVWQMVGF